MPRSDRVDVVIAYIGDEQPAWGRTAFHMQRHYYVMPAALYLQAILQAQGSCKARALYLNRSTQSFDEMVGLLREGSPAIVGLSCYSWNAADALALAAALAAAPSRPRVILGGPEVAFADPAEAALLLARHPAVDAIVLGEGEAVVGDVVDTLLGRRPPEPIPGAVFRTTDEPVTAPHEQVILDLEAIPRIDPTEVQVPLGPGAGLAVVYQTYRGCPYSCAYCSFHGGTAGIRRFPLDRVRQELAALLEARVPCIHFADSVFDLKRSWAKQILTDCLEHNRETSLFCYAAFQSMDDELAELFERSRIQVGVGLQSTDEQVLARVGRRFSVRRFEESLRALKGRRINWYADVMFGLPGDNPSGFCRTIDQLIRLDAPFVMPFPLTIIPRTKLAADLDGFEIQRFDDARIRDQVRPTSGIVYADIGLHNRFGIDDLKRFDAMATAVFLVLQRYPAGMRALFDYADTTVDREHGLTPAGVLELIGRRLGEHLGGAAVDVLDPPPVDGAVRQSTAEALMQMGASQIEVEGHAALMRLEGALDPLWRRSDRRGRFRKILGRARRRCEPDLSGSWRPEGETVAFVADHRIMRLPFCYADLERLAEVGSRLRSCESRVAVLLPYDHFAVSVLDLTPTEIAFCEVVPEDREVALSKVLRRIERHVDEQSWRAALARLTEAGLLALYRPEATHVC